MPYVLAQSTPPGPPSQPVHIDAPCFPNRHHHHHHHHLRRSPSQTHLAQPHDLTTFPEFNSAPDAGSASPSSGIAVPFPKLPSRRKRVRGVGTLPWHRTLSASGSSDSESDSSPSSSSTPSPLLLPALPIAPPPPPRHAVVRSTPPLKLDLSAVSRRTLSESQIANATPPTAFGPFSSSTTPIYRKNGTPVKSSLKSSRGSPTGRSESNVAGASAGQPSLPNTPSAEKIVHFDAQLEQIKFFNKHHKPSVISRGGSPEDTEEDSEFFSSGLDQQHLTRRKGASFYPGSSEEEKIRQTLVLEQVNIRLRNALAQPDEILGTSDVKLEKISLSTDAKLIDGAILVRNIAFEKWVAVRFTFDRWQTTSEVTARYCESIPEYNMDRFEYSIRVPDVTNKIEEKRLFVAIRYTSAGREMWDNNNGENYQLRFKRTTAPEKKVHPPSWPVTSANVDQMADLRRKLEKVVQENEEEEGKNKWETLTARLRARNMHIEEERSNEQPLSLRKRYDFQESSKVKWKAPEDLPKVNIPPSAASIPFPSSSARSPSRKIEGGLPTSPRLHVSPPVRGSPLLDPELEHSPKFFIDPREGDPWQHPHHQRSHSHSPSATRGRHHQRGYFDSWFEDATAQGLRLTPSSNPSTPRLAAPAATITPTTSTARSAPAPAPEEILSETESNSSIASTSSSSTSIAEDMGLSFVGDRSTVRYNSFPMDRSHISTPAAASASASAPDAHPTPQAWIVGPPGSSESFSSTPSITSASSPSQCPSSPSESMLDASSEGRFGASTLENLDYNYFLSRFCYFTGSEAPETRFGHRQSASDSDIFHSSASTHPAQARRHSMTSSEPWVGGQPAIQEDELELNGTHSGHTTPTRSPMTPNFNGFPGAEKEKGMVTPRAGSPLFSNAKGDAERTPRPAFDFVRPFRGSL